MPLDRLIKAKKSVSGIFSRMSSAPIQPCSPERNENAAPSRETRGPYSPEASSAVPDASDESPAKDTSSLRKGLMGSLRKQKLRSISSLQSLWSPTKTRQSDTPASPLAEGPQTPKCRLDSSLVLGFKESLPDKPIFELGRRDSIASSLNVHHSSPVPVPTSAKQKVPSSVDSSLIPFGTVPLSPAPIQRILELDQTETHPSPLSILAHDPASGTMRRPASTKSVLSDGLQGTEVYFDEPVVSYDSDLNDLLPDECFTQTDNIKESRQIIACKEPSWIHGSEKSLDHKTNAEQDGAQGSAIYRASNAANVNKTAEEHAKVILDKGYYARAYRRADGKCRLKVKLLASDFKDGDDDAKWDNEPPFRFAGPQGDRLALELGVIVRGNGMISISDDKINEAFAGGKLPAYLDIALDGDNAKNAQGRLYNPARTRKRDNIWGQHTGLYDGSGYGAGSSLRPVTGVTETADVPRIRISGAFSNHDNEAPTIMRRLRDNTYPHSLDTDYPGQATVDGAAVSEAQGQPESHFKDYKAFRDMLDPHGNV
ncbi:hypothetical protein G6011_10828 [Alternaria panax]|uniref:Uncharacterized protein n=1 Tax=Alternaria panax TaxID=48097 RepID=A0AAD4ICP2_9PLEO|nr:hypothetical protein G6011_10828 [Alternaria panax]